MKDLSIAQEYVLCVLNDSGIVPVMNTSAQVCVAAAALLELLLDDIVSIDEKKKIRVIAELPEEKSYLSGLYFWLKKSKPMKAEMVSAEYAMSLSSKKYKELLGGIGHSLVEANCATTSVAGLFKKKELFFPNKESVENVVQKIRAEFLEEGEMTKDIVALASLLKAANVINDYFSKYEAKDFKERLRQIKESDENGMIKEMLDFIDAVIILFAIV